MGTYQEEYLWSPVFITTELHHGLVWSYPWTWSAQKSSGFTADELMVQVLGIVSSGQDTIEKALALRPDLILMDIRLLGPMDGIEAAGRIRG